MGKKEKIKKNDPFKGIIEKWKKIDSEKRLFIIIVAILLAFIMFMPNIYKSWVSFRDRGFRFWNHSSSNKNKGKTLTMTCTQSVEDSDYKTEINTIIYYIDDKLKKEDRTTIITALSDYGKEDLPIRKSLYDTTEKSYKKYDGFNVKSELKNNRFSFHVITDYTKIDRETINKNGEEGNREIVVDLQLDQNIESVKSYYENLGLTCKKN